MKNLVDYRDYLKEQIKNPIDALHYLKASLEEYKQDDNLEAFLIALKTIAEAQVGLAKLAKNTNLNRQHLYKILSSKGNPRLTTLDTIMRSLGYRITVEAIPLSGKKPVKKSQRKTTTARKNKTK